MNNILKAYEVNKYTYDACRGNYKNEDMEVGHLMKINLQM